MTKTTTGPGYARVALSRVSTVDAYGAKLSFLDQVESTERPGHRATVGPVYEDGTFDVCDIDVGLFAGQRPHQWRLVEPHRRS